jgi:hypothetical protein
MNKHSLRTVRGNSFTGDERVRPAGSGDHDAPREAGASRRMTLPG